MFSVRDPIKETRMKNNRRLFESALKERVSQRLKEKIVEYAEEKSPFNPNPVKSTAVTHRLPTESLQAQPTP